MSVLIKGMEMPETCWRCPMYRHRVSYCNAKHRSLGYADEPDKNRMVWCPLVEVPTSHGPLVDRDKIEIEEDDYWAELTITAPVIIEAEGEEENG